MKITCNGETKNIDSGTMLVTLIQDLDLNPDTVVAEEGHAAHRIPPQLEAHRGSLKDDDSVCPARRVSQS